MFKMFKMFVIITINIKIVLEVFKSLSSFKPISGEARSLKQTSTKKQIVKVAKLL